MRVALVLVFTAATLISCTSDAESGRVPSHASPEKWFNDRVPYMINRYQFQDARGHLWDEDTYMQNVKRARAEIDSVHYYRQNWERLQQDGVRMLESQGSLHPSLLPEHPAYSGWVAPGPGKRGPMYDIKVADLDPGNPLGRDNPDVAVFAHAQHLHDYTRTQYQTLLYSVKRADRRYIAGRSDRIGQYYVPEKANALPDGWSWSHQLTSSSKMRSLDVLEQFGYDPRRLYKSLGEHDEQNNHQIYEDESFRRRLLYNAKAYLRQFDDKSVKTRFYLYSWTTIKTDDTQTGDVWYQTPLFDVYTDNRVWMAEYGPPGHRKPSLDRIRFVPEKDQRKRVHLVPVSIVRPVDVSHSKKEVMMFRTVRRMTSAERRSYTVPFYAFRPRFTNRDISGRTRQRYSGRGVRFDMRNQDTGRPYGHPFTLYPYRPDLPDEDPSVNENQPALALRNRPAPPLPSNERALVTSNTQEIDARAAAVQPEVAELLQQAKRKKVWQGAQMPGESSGTNSVLSNLEQHLNPSSNAFRYVDGTDDSSTRADRLMPDLTRHTRLFEKFPHP